MLIAIFRRISLILEYYRESIQVLFYIINEIRVAIEILQYVLYADGLEMSQEYLHKCGFTVNIKRPSHFEAGQSTN